MDYYKMSAAEAALALQNKEVTSRELTASVLKRITEVEEEIRGFITLLDRDEILKEADKIDKARLAGEDLPFLAGIPMALKDNLCTRGIPTTCASKILAGYRPPYDAHVVEQLKIPGRFSWARPTRTSLPWDLLRRILPLYDPQPLG